MDAHDIGGLFFGYEVLDFLHVEDHSSHRSEAAEHPQAALKLFDFAADARRELHAQGSIPHPSAPRLWPTGDANIRVSSSFLLRIRASMS